MFGPKLGTTVGQTGHVIQAASTLHIGSRRLFVILTHRPARPEVTTVEEYNVATVIPESVTTDSGEVSHWEAGHYFYDPAKAWAAFVREASGMF